MNIVQTLSESLKIETMKSSINIFLLTYVAEKKSYAKLSVTLFDLSF